jgi:hypothetical protein
MTSENGEVMVGRTYPVFGLVKGTKSLEALPQTRSDMEFPAPVEYVEPESP